MHMHIYIGKNGAAADFHRHILYAQTAGITAFSAMYDWFHPSASFKVSMLRYMISK